MIEQTVLPFKLDETKDSITPHAGPALFGEFLHRVKLSESVDSHLPAPGSGAGYSPSKYVFPLVLMLNGGGRAMEALREPGADAAVRRLFRQRGIFPYRCFGPTTFSLFSSWRRYPRIGPGSSFARSVGSFTRRRAKWFITATVCG